MTALVILGMGLVLGLLLLYVRMERRRRRRELGLREATPSLRDLRRGDMGRIRDLDEALQLDSPAWTDTSYHGRRP